ncbi:hypothetical protein LOZ80_13865 [Paenibacillus sp. HWE-109]|uniref:hypothetical protein n=1 Tax=Paenibacillus sp. HWE-109 TaxID=1306526 RepID=UPI001EE0F0C2|nr:hypothetical protein [Paenibacillus sp. HWE-109]UKS29958.1 hypothetical protein LOZ80_13865 [Paenibacillus sp. HWE-109]
MNHKLKITFSILLYVFGILLWSYATKKPGEGFSNLGWGILGLAVTTLGGVCTVVSIIQLAVNCSFFQFNNDNQPFILRKLLSFFSYFLLSILFIFILGFVALLALEAMA